ncbi:MAG: TlpA disulfide reductase family protein [Actinomycetes bacterium]
MRIAAIIAAILALVAVLVVGLRQAGSENGGQSSDKSAPPTPSQAQSRLIGSPPALAAIHAQAAQLLPGGPTALDERLRALRGYPVVVNVWASWCGPCREEMPVLQEVSVDRGRKVAFLGVDLKDNVPAAKRLLAQFPVSYPSYGDPDGTVFSDNHLAGVPSTIFYSRSGKRQIIHSGPYLKAGDLNADINRYALVAK